MLKKLIPKEYGFFDLFEKHINTMVSGVEIFNEILKDCPSDHEGIHKIEEIEYNCDMIVHMTIDLLYKTFITPFDRDEISNLVHILDDIIDYVEESAQLIVLYEIEAVTPEIIEMGAILLKAVSLLEEAIGHLRKKNRAEKIRMAGKQIREYEGDGDAAMRRGISLLFKNEKDPLQVIKLKEIYDNIELAIDRTEDVVNILERILLEQ